MGGLDAIRTSDQGVVHSAPAPSSANAPIELASVRIVSDGELAPQLISKGQTAAW